MPLVLAGLALGLLFGYLVAVAFPCALRLSATLGVLAGVLTALVLPTLFTSP